MCEMSHVWQFEFKNGTNSLEIPEISQKYWFVFSN